MQETRQIILEILRDVGQATVDEIVIELRQRRGDITAVTVRHHISYLQRKRLISTPKLKHRATPGRPQHVYSLTDQAEGLFPNNYRHLAVGLIQQIGEKLPEQQANVILEGVADHMASEVDLHDLSLEQRLDRVIDYLNNHGYEAHWSTCHEGFLLTTTNCPYHHVAPQSDALCNMDMRLVSSLLGVVPRMLSRVAEGDSACTYLIPLLERQ